MVRGSLFLTLALAVSVTGRSAAAADPPGTAPYMARYRAWFAAADGNKDNSLDKQELARALRGAAAKPFDYVAPPKDAPKDKPEGEKPTAPPTGPKPDYSRYADYNLLVQLDKNGDEAISREEYESWARDLAAQQKAQADIQQRIIEAQLRLQQQVNKLKPNEKKKAEDDLKRQREQAQKQKQRIEQLEKNLRQAQQKQKAQAKKLQQQRNKKGKGR
jgi:DNA repair exonuclease SbcCD ATPase subunit